MDNAVAQRFNWTLLAQTLSQIYHSVLPLSQCWNLALYSSHQINCTTSHAMSKISPISLFECLIPTHAHPFNYQRLKQVGCFGFSHNWNCTANVAPAAKCYKVTGIERNTRAWQLWDKHTQHIFIIIQVILEQMCSQKHNKHNLLQLPAHLTIPWSTIQYIPLDLAPYIILPLPKTHRLSMSLLSVSMIATHYHYLLSLVTPTTWLTKKKCA